MSEQRLNSLDRFRKQPGRLVLEEHSHCEVPAGCGGVVLRWVNPRATVSLNLHLYAPAQATCWLDGVQVRMSKIDLTPGQHVLAIALEQADLSAGLLMVAAVMDPRPLDRPAFEVLSAGDGTWKYALAPPDEEWARVGFEDAGWPVLRAVPNPSLRREDFGSSACRRCAERGAACLGLGAPPAPRGNIWVRKVFEVPASS
jgi:hypothetical protein